MPGQYLGTLADQKSIDRELRNGEWLKGLDWLRVCFVGRSNVGKSSLINALLQAKLARVSQSPGKTRELHFYKWHEGDLVFVDLPGYGYAKTSKVDRDEWRRLIDSYMERDLRLGLILLLWDSRHGPSEADLDADAYFRMRKLPIIWVMTKSDAIKNQAERSRRLKEIEKLAVERRMMPENVAWVTVKDEKRIRAFGAQIKQRLGVE